MNDLLTIILKETYTLSQLKKRLKILEYYFQQKFFHASQNTDLSPKDTVWFNALPKSFLDTFNKDNLSQNLNNLTNKTKVLPILVIYLAFEADEQIIEQIGAKARSIFGPTLLLDIKYNTTLIAGCALSWKGVYKDYSLHEKIEERKLAILQNFKKFLR